MCTLCDTCTTEKLCNCIRCPFNKKYLDICNICLCENCDDTYCGFLIHARTSGEPICIKCIEEEYNVVYKKWYHTFGVTCNKHK